MLFQHLGIKDMSIMYHIFPTFVENTLLNNIIKQFYLSSFPYIIMYACSAVRLPWFLSSLDAFVGMCPWNYKLGYILPKWKCINTSKCVKVLETCTLRFWLRRNTTVWISKLDAQTWPHKKWATGDRSDETPFIHKLGVLNKFIHVSDLFIHL